jgi:hypothetical protein
MACHGDENMHCPEGYHQVVQNKVSDDYMVICPTTKVQKALAKLRPIIDSIPVKFYKNRTKTLFSPSWLGFSNTVIKINVTTQVI